jgi:hypothetical protein
MSAKALFLKKADDTPSRKGIALWQRPDLSFFPCFFVIRQGDTKPSHQNTLDLGLVLRTNLCGLCVSAVELSLAKAQTL